MQRTTKYSIRMNVGTENFLSCGCDESEPPENRLIHFLAFDGWQGVGRGCKTENVLSLRRLFI
jgi:hypothetical protein